MAVTYTEETLDDPLAFKLGLIDHGVMYILAELDESESLL